MKLQDQENIKIDSPASDLKDRLNMKGKSSPNINQSFKTIFESDMDHE